MIRMEDLSLSVGSQDLLLGGSWHIRPGSKVGLLGRNGVGKTTVLRLLAGELSPDSGTLHRRGGLHTGYLPQAGVHGAPGTVWDEASAGMLRLRRLARHLEAAQEAVEAGRTGALERLGEATEAFRLAGGYAMDERVGQVLHGLGFSRRDWNRSCLELSGGWQMRVALARLLLSDAQLLLLDEPGNHLDITARTWLAGFLERSRAAVVLVSHDRFLLERVCRSIVELRHRRFHHFSGGFRYWLQEREQRLHQERSALQAQQREIAKLERFIERFGAKASKASQARSRKKVLDRMDRPELPTDGPNPVFRLARPRRAWPGVLLGLRAATLAWPGGEPVLKDLDLAVEAGMRLVLLGPNGCGKTTLLAALAGQLPLVKGRRLVEPGLRIGYFSQHMAQDIAPGQSAVDAVLEAVPLAEFQVVRKALGALGLRGDLALQPVEELSGGERARVALARFAVQPCDILLLDEPTNHLDALSAQALSDALLDYQGALMLASHDRYLVESLATHVAFVEDGSLHVREGLRKSDLEPRAMAGPARSPGNPRGAQAWAERKRRLRARERQVRRLEAVQSELEQLEKQVLRLDRRMGREGADYELVARLIGDRQELDTRIRSLYQEWERLEAILES